MQNIIRRLLFEHWYFLSRTPWDTGVSPPEFIEFIETHKPGRAIDIGCGTGTNVVTLARAGWQVTGVDFASRAIRKAKRKAMEANVPAELYVRDATYMIGITGPFDLDSTSGAFMVFFRSVVQIIWMNWTESSPQAASGSCMDF